jgi:hypothetical protein
MMTLKIHQAAGIAVVAWFLLFYGLFRLCVEFFRDSESMIYGGSAWAKLAEPADVGWPRLYFLWHAAAEDRPSRTVNALMRKIHALIQAQGPLTVAQYMATALGDPEHGYYMRRRSLRAATSSLAPEVSQMFGELIGLFFVQAWEDRGSAEEIQRLVELGPGAER